MNLTIDIGNTSVKWGAFKGTTLAHFGTAHNMQEAALQWSQVGIVPQQSQILVAASGACPTLDFDYRLFSADLPLPIAIDYTTPGTLGADRLADACGAHSLYPSHDCLVIDAGTCITVDFVDAHGVYHGGAIMPGVRMNLQALHTFTNKLPLIEIATPAKAPLLGRSTEQSIVAGTLGATLLALAGYVAAYRAKSASLQVLITGGDAGLLLSGGNPGWQHIPHLTLMGINQVLNHINNQQ